MENVTLTPKEQSRLQVLNSLAAEHMTLDQAAELMGVIPATPAASWRPTVNAARRLWHMATAVAKALVVDLLRSRVHPPLLAEREGIHIGMRTAGSTGSPRRRRRATEC